MTRQLLRAPVHVSLAEASSPTGTFRWFLVRPVNCGGNGTYDEIELRQQGSRDLEIQAGAWGCP